MKDQIPVIEIAAPGGPEVLTIGARARPSPGPNQILIEVKAAGINGADLAQRKGVYPPPPGASDLLGMEVAGVVAQVNGAINTILAMPGIRDRYAAIGFETLTGPPERLTERVARETPMWADVVKRSGAQVD